MKAAVPTTDALEAVAADLHAWICEQPLWRQQAFRYLLSQPRLDEDQRAEIRDLLCAEVGCLGVKSRAAPKPIDSDEIGRRQGVRQTNRLHRLFGLTQVNALPEDTELRFIPAGLTIIYGHNGSGKSSYVRSLKRLCRSVDRDQSILPNVLRQGAQGGQPRAHIEWAPLGGEVTGQEFDLSDPALRTPVAEISIFDSRCAQIYVDLENQIAFVPSTIRVLVRLAEEQVTIQRELETAIAATEASRPDFGAIPAGTNARSAIDGLRATSAESALEELATLNDDERARRSRLELALAAAATGESERHQAQLHVQARGARDLIERLQAAAGMLAPTAVDELKAAVEELRKRRVAVIVAAEAAFAGEELVGVGGEPWKALWEAARRFYGTAHADHADVVFPDTSEGAGCPLCFQDLDEAARDRFQRFDAFVRSDSEARATEAERSLDDERARFSEQAISRCRTLFLDTLAETNEELHRLVTDWLRGAADLRELLLTAAAREDEWPAESLSAPPIEELERFASAREHEAEAVTLAVKPEERAAFQSELAELAARDVLGERLDDVRRWLAELRQIAALEKAKSELRTQGISLKQKALSEQVVTATLRDQLRLELDALGFTHIAFELKARGEHGTTMIQLRLRDAPEEKLAPILSDGEKRALALAFFLAEIATAEGQDGIVLDDPVSSLDQERRQAVAQRIASESSQRQVILFTHDIAFLFHVQLEAEALGLEPKVQQVWRDGQAVGRTAAEAPFDASRVKERIAWLERTLQDMPKEGEFRSDDERRMHVSSWYRHLRGSWERAVEEIVFNEAVQRFTPHVQTQRLNKVAITPEMLESIEHGMSNCSTWMHDQPAAGAVALPSRLQMRDDLDAFREFCKKHRPK
ncbi:MAG TPA: AAA family ATPase [Thermoanaerobaculia bacterium]|nr:AAA family ATPase [Thermoanaerobaculia bacterium]